jgi:hypothetical protein
MSTTYAACGDRKDDMTRRRTKRAIGLARIRRRVPEVRANLPLLLNAV